MRWIMSSSFYSLAEIQHNRKLVFQRLGFSIVDLSPVPKLIFLNTTFLELDVHRNKTFLGDLISTCLLGRLRWCIGGTYWTCTRFIVEP